MDANKLHRQIESPARTRIRASAANHGASSAPTHRDDGTIKAELHREELDYNGDGIVTLGEFYDYASKSIATNIPKYMKKSWYWGDKKKVQVTRFYAGKLKNLVLYKTE